jgi:hypothetical protein
LETLDQAINGGTDQLCPHHGDLLLEELKIQLWGLRIGYWVLGIGYGYWVLGLEIGDSARVTLGRVAMKIRHFSGDLPGFL